MFPRDVVCLRNISVDTLHKGDTEDNNNNNNNMVTSIRLNYLIAEKFCLLRNTATYNMGEFMFF